MKSLFLKSLLKSACYVFILFVCQLAIADELGGFRVLFNPVDTCIGEKGWFGCIMQPNTSIPSYPAMIQVDYFDEQMIPSIVFYQGGEDKGSASFRCKNSAKYNKGTITCLGSIPLEFYRREEGGRIIAVKTTVSIFDGEMPIYEGEIISNPVPEIDHEVRRVAQEDFGADAEGKLINPGYPSILMPDMDTDSDKILHREDNCPFQSNQDQADVDNDGIGDACDWDSQNDGIFDFVQKEVDLQGTPSAVPAPSAVPQEDIKPRVPDEVKPGIANPTIDFSGNKIMTGSGGCSLGVSSGGDLLDELFGVILATFIVLLVRARTSKQG